MSLIIQKRRYDLTIADHCYSSDMILMHVCNIGVLTSLLIVFIICKLNVLTRRVSKKIEGIFSIKIDDFYQILNQILVVHSMTFNAQIITINDPREI